MTDKEAGSPAPIEPTTATQGTQLRTLTTSLSEMHVKALLENSQKDTFKIHSSPGPQPANPFLNAASSKSGNMPGPASTTTPAFSKAFSAIQLEHEAEHKALRAEFKTDMRALIDEMEMNFAKEKEELMTQHKHALRAVHDESASECRRHEGIRMGMKAMEKKIEAYQVKVMALEKEAMIEKGYERLAKGMELKLYEVEDEMVVLKQKHAEEMVALEKKHAEELATMTVVHEGKVKSMENQTVMLKQYEQLVEVMKGKTVAKDKEVAMLKEKHTRGLNHVKECYAVAMGNMHNEYEKLVKGEKANFVGLQEEMAELGKAYEEVLEKLMPKNDVSLIDGDDEHDGVSSMSAESEAGG
ncbi:Hypothetical protein D9617_6g096000 [Elsinoe fawcettii]|nr:Hypothetical protein D9617_6g096000 [Elsinoe fawcettii]